MKINIYDINNEYLEYLKSKEFQERGFSTVPNFGYENEGRERKFACGPVVKIKGISYFVFASHKTILNDDALPVIFEREQGVVKGTLRFQYMIPVPDSQLKLRNLHTETISRKNFLFSYLKSVEKNHESIFNKALEVYYKQTKGLIPTHISTKFNDFKFLESKMIQHELNKKMGLKNEEEIQISFNEKKDIFEVMYEDYRREVTEELFNDINSLAHIVEEDLDHINNINMMELPDLAEQELDM